ncbi:HypC/HybG/HupF family hydrogenase formation chaperone [Pseudolysobacter antarcticus]|uniref:HypC/HybG/HupF family hydrogenase formation chaperone n=1 Tax=Pseudolysobacter antarcticus TaxID=2511995 RepID=A0A411HNS1_9GAMM|nr:HypC/HybG/HupF family hydrogenase formation chaperone [Pseudolysobacter antarcticus]QBB72116.1 HypC/HybG/HupF family hydrogenase formation chaperone [Pseudolysobacter antarcticus]
MCLGIPGRIIAITNSNAKLATVDVLGVQREINIACVLGENETASDCIGAWVLVHVGFAMSRIDEREAELTLQLLHELGEAQAEARTMRESAMP